MTNAIAESGPGWIGRVGPISMTYEAADQNEFNSRLSNSFWHDKFPTGIIVTPGSLIKVYFVENVDVLVVESIVGNVVEVVSLIVSDVDAPAANFSYVAFQGKKWSGIGTPADNLDNAALFAIADSLNIPVYVGPGNYFTKRKPTGLYFGEGVIYWQIPDTTPTVRYPIFLGATPVKVGTDFEFLEWKDILPALPGEQPSDLYEQYLNVTIGPRAGVNFTHETKRTVAVGYKALEMAGGACTSSTAIGSKALASCVAPINSEAIGNGAMAHSTFTDRNTCLGDAAGKWAGCKDPVNTYHGYFHADYPDGTNLFKPWTDVDPTARAIVGPTEGPPNTPDKYVNSTIPQNNGHNADNVYYGRDAGNYNVKGNYNVFIGSHCAHGWNTSGSIFIGGKCGTRALTADNCVGIGLLCLTSNTRGTFNTAGGVQSMLNNAFGSTNTAWGAYTLKSLTGYSASVDKSMPDAAREQAKNNVAVGYEALTALIYGVGNNAMGANAFFRLENGSNNTAVGQSAGRFLIGGSALTSENNVTCLGYMSKCSGPNQVNLGDSSTTTYVYAFHNFSDLRDKTDVRETSLGLPFIEELRPVEYRYDYRDAYVEEDGTLLPKDGSRSGTRFHQGLIAQEVKTAMDKLGVDFGGYQDHKVNGGEDVLTLGYTELIGPLIKAVQEPSAANRALTTRVAALERAGGGDPIPA